MTLLLEKISRTQKKITLQRNSLILYYLQKIVVINQCIYLDELN